MTRKMIVFLITAILFMSLAPADLSANESDYAWILVETQYRGLGPHASTDYFNSPQGEHSHTDFYTYYINHEEERVEFRRTSPYGRNRNTDPPMNFHIVYTWSKPPQVIQPNETITLRLNQEVISNQPGGYSTSYHWRARTGQFWNFTIVEPAKYAGKETVLIGSATTRDPDNLMQESGSLVFTREAWNPGREGRQQTLQISTGVGSAAQQVVERYIYEWKKVPAAAPAPAPAPEPAPQPGRFSDLDPGHWAHDDIMDMVERGILSGYPDGTFRPNQVVTRAEFAKIMVQALELQAARPASPTFTDVGTDHWAFNDVESARDYLTGYRNPRTGEMSFLPGGDAVREDVAVAIVKAQGYGDETANLSLLNQFSDQGEISDALRNHVAIAVEKGYMQGTNIGFEPQKPLTRAEACTLLLRIIQAELEKVTL